MNTDQGSQFTSFAWTDRLRRTGVRISVDGKGRFLDNIFVERLWRTLKYEFVYLHAWEPGLEAKAGIRKWMTFSNQQRPHSALGGRPPAVVYLPGKDETQPDQQVQRVAKTTPETVQPMGSSLITARWGNPLCPDAHGATAALPRSRHPGIEQQHGRTNDAFRHHWPQELPVRWVKDRRQSCCHRSHRDRNH